MENKSNFSYELDGDAIIIEYKNYSAGFNFNFIKQDIPEAVTDDQIDYSKLMGILDSLNWKIHDLYMVAKINKQKGILLMRDSYEAEIAALEYNINNYLNPLFNKHDKYHKEFREALLGIAEEITDNREFVMQNGKKYKIKLVEV